MKKLFLALPLFLAACQSERVAFRFQPVAPAVGTVPPRRATSEAAVPGPVPRVTPAAVVPPAAEAPAVFAKLVGRQGKISRTRRPVPAGPVAFAELPAAPPVSVGPVAMPRPLLKRLVRQRATAGPARTTENGLAGIFFFFLAVVLAVLAGLGVLVSLIPGVSFWGGVGLAAGGLLLLFLLYSLLSGGKKKKAPAK